MYVCMFVWMQYTVMILCISISSQLSVMLLLEYDRYEEKPENHFVDSAVSLFGRAVRVFQTVIAMG